MQWEARTPRPAVAYPAAHLGRQTWQQQHYSRQPHQTSSWADPLLEHLLSRLLYTPPSTPSYFPTRIPYFPSPTLLLAPQPKLALLLSSGRLQRCHVRASSAPLVAPADALSGAASPAPCRPDKQAAGESRSAKKPPFHSASDCFVRLCCNQLGAAVT